LPPPPCLVCASLESLRLYYSDDQDGCQCVSAFHASLYFPGGNYTNFSYVHRAELIDVIAREFAVEKTQVVIDAVQPGSIHVLFQIQPPLGRYRGDQQRVKGFRSKVIKGHLDFRIGDGALVAALGTEDAGFVSTVEVFPDFDYPVGFLGDGRSTALVLVSLCAASVFLAGVAGVIQLARYYDWSHAKERRLNQGWAGLSPEEREDFLAYDKAGVEEEITAENEIRIARKRFEALMEARERERVAAPWVMPAMPGAGAGKDPLRPPRTRVLINPLNGTVTGPPTASRWVMGYLGLTDLDYKMPETVEDDGGFAAFRKAEATAADAGLRAEELDALMAVTPAAGSGMMEGNVVQAHQEEQEQQGDLSVRVPGSL
jgi:hypothetical protein